MAGRIWVSFRCMRVWDSLPFLKLSLWEHSAHGPVLKPFMSCYVALFWAYFQADRLGSAKHYLLPSPICGAEHRTRVGSEHLCLAETLQGSQFPPCSNLAVGVGWGPQGKKFAAPPPWTLLDSGLHRAPGFPIVLKPFSKSGSPFGACELSLSTGWSTLLYRGAVGHTSCLQECNGDQLYSARAQWGLQGYNEHLPLQGCSRVGTSCPCASTSMAQILSLRVGIWDLSPKGTSSVGGRAVGPGTPEQD